MPLEARIVGNPTKDCLLRDISAMKSFIENGEYINAKIMANSVHKQLVQLTKVAK